MIVFNFGQSVLTQLLLVKHAHLVRDLHRDRFQEEVLTHAPLDRAFALLDLLLLLGRVLQGVRFGTVATRLDLLVECHGHVGLLQLGGKLPKPRIILLLWMIIIDGVTFNLLVYFDEDALITLNDQVTKNIQSGANCTIWIFFILIRALILLQLSLYVRQRATLQKFSVVAPVKRVLSFSVKVSLRDLVQLQSTLQLLLLNHRIELHLRLLIV